MAFSASNPDQIMETQTKFDLSDSLAQWRAACAQSATLCPENRAELEAHLHDSMAALRRQGLSEEEAFLVGTKRLGSPSKLAAEFGKVNASEVWFSRLAWMFAGTLLMSAVHVSVSILGTGSAILWTKLGNQPLSFSRFYGWETGWLHTVVGLCLTVLPLVGWFWAARWLLINYSSFDFSPNKPVRVLLAFGALAAAISLTSLFAMRGLAVWGNLTGVMWTSAIWGIAVREVFRAFAIPFTFYVAWKYFAKRQTALSRGQ